MLTCSCCRKLQFEFNLEIQKIAKKLMSKAKKDHLAEEEKRKEKQEKE